MTLSAGSEWLFSLVRGSRLLQPGDELRELTAARARAEDRGDVAQLEAIDGELDQLFASVREGIDDEKAAKAKAARFSSGARRPIVKKPSQSARMNQAILQRTGRVR